MDTESCNEGGDAKARDTANAAWKKLRCYVGQYTVNTTFETKFLADDDAKAAEILSALADKHANELASADPKLIGTGFKTRSLVEVSKIETQQCPYCYGQGSIDLAISSTIPKHKVPMVCMACVGAGVVFKQPALEQDQSTGPIHHDL